MAVVEQKHSKVTQLSRHSQGNLAHKQNNIEK